MTNNQKLKVIEDVTGLANKAFSRIARELRRCVEALQETLETQGEDYAAFDQAGKETVLRSVTFTSLAKAMIDTPILDEDGTLVLSTQKAKAISDAAGDAQTLLELLTGPDTAKAKAA